MAKLDPLPKPCTVPTTPETTLACIQRDFTEWRQGRTHYAVWALDADIAPIRAAMAHVCTHLGDCLLPGYERQAHITLHLCGFPAASAILPDDWPLAMRERQRNALRTANLSPFTLAIGLADSFSSAPYLSVHDPVGGIAQLRRALGENDRECAPPYVPHVTCGLYGGEYAMATVHEKLHAANTALPPRQLPVNAVHLMVYEAAVIGGPLHILESFDLRTQQFAAA